METLILPLDLGKAPSLPALAIPMQQGRIADQTLLHRRGNRVSSEIAPIDRPEAEKRVVQRADKCSISASYGVQRGD